MALKTSIKHLQISKTQTNLLIVIAAAIVISIFSLFAIKALVVKGLYQNRVLNEKHRIVKQLKDNYQTARVLIDQYNNFSQSEPNVVGGTVNGKGNLDGSNPRVVLDALPSIYDAPALAASIEKILSGRNVSIDSIDVKDDSASNSSQPKANPTTVPLNLSFKSTSTYATTQKLIKDFERSIRPFDIVSLEFNGKDDSLSTTLNMITYYQPARSLNLDLTTEVK